MIISIFFVILFLFLSFLSLIVTMIEKDIESPLYKFDCFFYFFSFLSLIVTIIEKERYRKSKDKNIGFYRYIGT